MTGELVSSLVLGPGWTRSVTSDHILYCSGAEAVVEVEVRRSIAGPLRDAYPVSAHDVEVRIVRHTGEIGVPAALAELRGAILNADSRCRRVVFAAAADDETMRAAAASAGFRYVLDVEVPGAELSLMVAEPTWVTRSDADLDRVPGC